MPTFTHGKNAKLSIGPIGNMVDVSDVISQANMSRTADTAEVTSFGNSAKAYIPGLRDATISLEGMVDTGGAIRLDNILGEMAEVEYKPEGDTGITYSGQGILTSLEITAEVGGAVTISGEVQMSGEMTVA
jgi:hypothetical protein